MDMIGKVRRMKLRDGLSYSEIARRTGLSRNTVKKWLKAGSGVEPQYKREPIGLSLRHLNILGNRTAIPLLWRAERAMPSKPSSYTSVGSTLRTGPKLSRVVLRTMASTWRISSSVRPEYTLAKGTSVRSASSAPHLCA